MTIFTCPQNGRELGKSSCNPSGRDFSETVFDVAHFQSFDIRSETQPYIVLEPDISIYRGPIIDGERFGNNDCLLYLKCIYIITAKIYIIPQKSFSYIKLLSINEHSRKMNYLPVDSF